MLLALLMLQANHPILASGSSTDRVESSAYQASALLRYTLAAEQDPQGRVTLTVTVTRDRSAAIGSDPGFLRTVRIEGGAPIFTPAVPQFRGCDGKQLCWYAQTIAVRLTESDLAARAADASLDLVFYWQKGPPDLLSIPRIDIQELLAELANSD